MINLCFNLINLVPRPSAFYAFNYVLYLINQNTRDSLYFFGTAAFFVYVDRTIQIIKFSRLSFKRHYDNLMFPQRTPLAFGQERLRNLLQAS